VAPYWNPSGGEKSEYGNKEKNNNINNNDNKYKNINNNKHNNYPMVMWVVYLIGNCLWFIY
jgi:hypothetical protein